MPKQASDTSFGPRRRVKKREDFLRIQGRGKKFRGTHFLLVVSPARFRPQSYIPKAESRLGITITKKIDKRAVRRNAVKRRVREVFRGTRAKFKQAVDLVVIAQGEAASLNYEQINQELHELFKRAKLL